MVALRARLPPGCRLHYALRRACPRRHPLLLDDVWRVDSCGGAGCRQATPGLDDEPASFHAIASFLLDAKDPGLAPAVSGPLLELGPQSTPSRSLGSAKSTVTCLRPFRHKEW